MLASDDVPFSECDVALLCLPTRLGHRLNQVTTETWEADKSTFFLAGDPTLELPECMVRANLGSSISRLLAARLLWFIPERPDTNVCLYFGST